jgi:hypothetical protein
MEEQLKEKRELKKGWTNKFLSELDIILEKCFLMPKKKKEHFITKEKLEVEIIRLLQSQTKNVSLKDVKEDLLNIAVFDQKDNIIGRIISIDLIKSQVTFENMFQRVNTKSFDDLMFFNFKTIECVAAFDRQKLFYDKFSYRDTYRFLMSNNVSSNEAPKRMEYYSFDRTNQHVKVRVTHE